jgi:hypothetical protein
MGLMLNHIIILISQSLYIQTIDFLNPSTAIQYTESV